ncbi:MAG: LamG domain-containing protein [Myxococcota bacterium]
MLAASALGLISSVAPTSASAALRSATVVFSYPPSGNFAGVALYYAASRDDLAAAVNLTRIDLGLPGADGQGLVSVSVPGFDDSRDYYVALRCYDAQANESGNSAVGVIAAAVASAGPLYQEDFESYVPGQDPAGWVDSGPGTTAPGDAAFFETAQLPDGTIAFEAKAAGGEIHSHYDVPGTASWSSYEYSGRLQSDSASDFIGVTVLSAYPDAAFYYRLARQATSAFSVAKRGGGGLACAGASSTPVGVSAGVWFQFRVRATRFDGRNRIRASIWPAGGTAPSAWQIDCWDVDPEGAAAGRIGVYSVGAGNRWDDLRVDSVSSDGAPAGYGVTPPPPPPPTSPPPSGGVSGGSSGSTGGSSPGAYTSATASELAHWWRPGVDVSALGEDFAPSGGIDASTDARGVTATDVALGGSTGAEIDLDGKSEALGNFALRQYGIGDRWSLGIWLRPVKVPHIGTAYAFDLNGGSATKGRSGISLVLNSKGRFAITVSDSAGRARSLVSSATVTGSQLGSAWYHVVAVKDGSNSLALYVNGVLDVGTNIGVPTQTDAPRALRIGGRVKTKNGHFWRGGIGSVALWHSALRSSEVGAAYARGNRGANLSAAIPAP